MEITYDTIGNPLTDGTWTYTWEHGRQLASMTDGTTTWSYEYNADGLRTSRSNGTTTYNYVYNGTSLVQMTVGDDLLYFAYDSSSPMTVTYNGVVYYYVTNLQGDVIAILDATGTAVVTYSYDAWGNILTTSGTMADTLGTVNPLRYRGYVYDTETGLYYLQSRYYNPEIGRFLNSDVLVSTGQGFLSNNMFAYCGNNPITYSDYSGTKRQVWFQLFEDRDPGYIHRAVQVHILVTNNIFSLVVKSEYSMPGVGRADIICPETGEMWEIKYGGSSTESWAAGISLATSQLDRYISKGCDFKKGRAYRFFGHFTIDFGTRRCNVTYCTPAEGVILYKIEYTDDMDGEPAFSYAPYTLYEEQKKAMTFVFGLACCFAGGIQFATREQIGECSYG